MITKNNNSLCRQAKPYYYDHLSDEGCGLVPDSISRHIEKCRSCQQQIEQLKLALSQKVGIKSMHKQNTSAVTAMLELHFAYIGKYVTCDTVRPFLPGMLDPDIEIRVPTPITVHLDNCSQCIEDLKAIKKLNLNSTQLYRLSQLFSEGPSEDTKEFSEMPAVLAMAKRADSEVVTIYQMDESAKARKTAKSDDLYAGFPITIEVIKQKVDIGPSVSNVDYTDASKEEKVPRIKLLSFLKAGIAAAAVILVGLALFHNTTSAKADIRVKISNAIKDLTGVHISTYSADRTKLIQERWISKDSGLYVTKAANGPLVVCDILKGEQAIKHLDTSAIETISLPKDIRISIEKKMSGSLGLMPIYDISNLPRDYEWLPVDDHPKAAEGFEIYDLKWNVQKNQLRKWRYFIDSKTFLPKEVEIYGTELEMVMLAESKSDSDIRKAIQEAGF